MSDALNTASGRDKKKSTAAKYLGKVATALGLRVLARWVYEAFLN